MAERPLITAFPLVSRPDGVSGLWDDFNAMFRHFPFPVALQPYAATKEGAVHTLRFRANGNTLVLQIDFSCVSVKEVPYVCTTHFADGEGEVSEGNLWDDDDAFQSIGRQFERLV
jgi:hypothetical protein